MTQDQNNNPNNTSNDSQNTPSSSMDNPPKRPTRRILNESFGQKIFDEEKEK